jgi:hypothetical protein
MSFPLPRGSTFASYSSGLQLARSLQLLTSLSRNFKPTA